MAKLLREPNEDRRSDGAADEFPAGGVAAGPGLGAKEELDTSVTVSFM